MPRYFFSVMSRRGLIEAESAEELSDNLAAHRFAQQTARELGGGSLDGLALVVKGDDGEIITETPIGDPPAN